MNWILRLYPRAWQRRYRHEVTEVIAAQPWSPGLLIDLLGGAIDAWVNPQSITTSHKRGVPDAMTGILRSCSARAESTVSPLQVAALMIGATLGTAMLALGLERVVGANPYTEALLNASFFVALAISTVQYSGAVACSRRARSIILAAEIVLLYAIFLAAALLTR